MLTARTGPAVADQSRFRRHRAGGEQKTLADQSRSRRHRAGGEQKTLADQSRSRRHKAGGEQTDAAASHAPAGTGPAVSRQTFSRPVTLPPAQGRR
jgi:hypothetical protein